MRCAEWYGDREGAADAGLTFNCDVTAEQLDELLHKRKPNAAALERASACALDATKAFEQVRKFLRRDTDASVDDGKLGRRAIARCLHANCDLPRKGKLEGI